MAKVMLKRIGILSVAKWQAMFMFILGVFAGLVYVATIMFYDASNLSLIVFYTLATPVIYCVIGFLAAVIGALFYNILASSVGGVVLEFEQAETEFLPPPPPTQF